MASLERTAYINALVDALESRGIELPAFSTLDSLAEQAHAAMQSALFQRVMGRLTPALIDTLDRLLATDFGRRQSDFNALKQVPKRPSRNHLEILIDHLAWLESFGDLSAIFDEVRESKIRHFASQARVFDVAELKECTAPKRYTLMLALIQQMRVRTRDHLAEMFMRRMATIHKRAKDELQQIQLRQRSQTEKLVATLDGVLEILTEEHNDKKAGHRIRHYVAGRGNIDALRQTCAEVQAISGDHCCPDVEHAKHGNCLI